MFSAAESSNDAYQTRMAFLWTRILSIPFWTIANMLSFILYKDLHISALQVTAIVAMKPVSALFASYWSVSIQHRQDRLVSNIVYANIFRFVPFLFIPWIDSAWVMILAFGLYMTLSKGVTPAWMEMFKLNLKGDSREKTFAYISAVDYLGGAIMPFLIGWILDQQVQAWRWLFPVTAIFGIISTYFLWRIPSKPLMAPQTIGRQEILSFKDKLIKPWKDGWVLIKKRPDFAKFQIAFMLGGAGLMMMMSAQPIFFIDNLHLSYTEIAFAMTLCKGIAVAISSPMWVRLFGKLDIFHFTAFVTALCGIFPFILLGAQYHLVFLYIAYLVYGLMQGGSELSWNMSGPVFSQEKDSSVFSRTNVLAGGVRGCIMPLVGSALLYFTHSPALVLMCGAALCLAATERLWRYTREPARQASFPEYASGD
jgi:MFS transporter